MGTEFDRQELERRLVKFDQQELERRMAKGIVVCRLRDTLTRFGIPENEQVTVSLKHGNQVLASCEIQPTGRKTRIEKIGMSLEAFSNEVIDGFLEPTEVLFNISEALPDLDESANDTMTIRLGFEVVDLIDIGVLTLLVCNINPNRPECFRRPRPNIPKP